MDISTHKIPLSPQKSPKTTPFPPSITTVTENDDLLTTILCLLPTKSVSKFKSVSKHWLSLLSHSSFSLLHAAHSPPQPPSSLLFPHPNNNSLFHSIPLKPTICSSTLSASNYHTDAPLTSLYFTNDPSGEIEIVQSCNGLLLCSSGTPWDGIDTRIFYIYNPTTKKFTTLPPPDNPPARHLSLSIFTKVNLAFDPLKSPYYKVVLVRKADGRTGFYRVNVFCSKMGRWRACEDHVNWPSFEVFCKGVYFNGAVHWGSKRDGFLCFDVERECFKLMPVLPEFRTGNSTIRYFGESSGKLYLVDAWGLEFDVFEMERDYSGWVPKFQVDLGRVFGLYPCLFSPAQCDFSIEKGNISIISVVSEGDDKGGLCLVLHVPGKILSYNLRSEDLKVIKDGFLGNVERMIPALVKGFGGYQHFESLASV